MQSPSILVVSAEESAFEVETPARRVGGDVLRARSGSEALQMIAEHSPDLVIFSSHLGDLDPPLFCRSVRDDDGIREVSLLGVMDGDEDMADLCLAAGCNDVVRTPFDDAEFDSRIASLSDIPVRKELRTLIKLELKLDVELELSIESEGKFFLGHSLNVSKNGILVQTSKVFDPEAHVFVKFYLHHDPVPVRAEAQVVRAEFAGGSPMYGLKFVDLSDDETARLEKCLGRLRGPQQ